MIAGQRRQRTGGAGRPVLMLIGWDGASPDLLERFCAAGKLPTVQRLIEAGSYRRLRSTIPPVTACAWPSFLSGRNPGKHGLFDFVRPHEGNYRFDYTNGGSRKDRNSDIVALLNQAGLRVGEADVHVEVAIERDEHAVVGGSFTQLGAIGEPEGPRETPVQLLGLVQRLVSHTCGTPPRGEVGYALRRMVPARRRGAHADTVPAEPAS